MQFYTSKPTWCIDLVLVGWLDPLPIAHVHSFWLPKKKKGWREGKITWTQKKRRVKLLGWPCKKKHYTHPHPLKVYIYIQEKEIKRPEWENIRKAWIFNIPIGYSHYTEPHQNLMYQITQENIWRLNFLPNHHRGVLETNSVLSSNQFKAILIPSQLKNYGFGCT